MNITGRGEMIFGNNVLKYIEDSSQEASLSSFVVVKQPDAEVGK